MPQRCPKTRPLVLRLAQFLFAAALAFSPVLPARADLLGTPTSEPMLSAAEQQLLADNPALRQLAIDAPDQLHAALAIIAKAQASGVVGKGDFDGLDETDVRLLGRNPALLQVWRSSPEASAELLQLIRTAAGERRPSK